MFHILIQPLSLVTHATGKLGSVLVSVQGEPTPSPSKSVPLHLTAVSCTRALSTHPAEMRSLCFNYSDIHRERGKRAINSLAWWLRQPEENLAICSNPLSKNGPYFFIQGLLYLVHNSRAAHNTILPRPQ